MKKTNAIKELVVKANELIEMPVDFTIMQLKLFAKIIVAMRNDPDIEFYEFSVKSLLKDFGITENNHTQLKLATKGLIRPVTIKGDLDDEDQLPFFDRVRYSNGIVKFRMTSDLKPLILNLEKNYTQYYFSNIARLKSTYSIRMYELLKQYQFKNERTLSLQELKFFLKIEDEKYEQYGHFKSKVIIVAQKELEEKTDIYFSFEEIKEGRKIIKIKFFIFKNKNNLDDIQNNVIKNEVCNNEIEKLKGIELTDRQEEVVIILTNNYRLSRKVALELIRNVSIEQILRNIEHSDKEYNSGNITKNLTGYLVGAIKNDYANTTSLFELDVKKKTTDKENEKRKKEMEEKKEDLRSKFSREFSRIEKERFINLLNDKEKENLKNEIIESLSNDLLLANSVKAKGLISPAAGLELIKRIPNFEKRREQFIAEKLKEAGFE